MYSYNFFRFKAAYTFDAGPNACIYLLENEVEPFIAELNNLYPNDTTPQEEYVRGIPVQLNRNNDLVGFVRQP